MEEKVEDPVIVGMAADARRLIIESRRDGDKKRTTGASATSHAATISKVEAALKDVGDPLVPVRGHALLVLSKLVADKDAEATSRREELLEIFLAHLVDEDTYVYLNAVKGLESLAVTFPDRIIPTLCREFVEERREGSGEAAFRRRLTLGEGLSR